MIKHYCDRCGAEMAQFNIGTVTVDYRPWAKWEATEKKYDLCSECLAKVELFIQKGDKE